MTLDEAIRHAEECAKSCDRLADLCVEDTSRSRNHRCAEEHRQLAEWLKELKAYRETYPYGVDRFNGVDTPLTEGSE